MTASPMRIAMMLESDGPGGAEMMVFRLSEELRNRGHTIVPVGPMNGIGWLGDLFRGAGVSPETFRLRRAIDPGCVRGLVELFKKHRIDAVHSHEFAMAVYGAAATRLLGLPHVITMHGGFTVCRALRRRIALRWAMRSADDTVMVSRATRHQFAGDLGVPESDFSVIPNGVPVRLGDAANVRREFGIQPGERVLLAVGTLEKHKGHRVLIEAMARLSARDLSVPWRLIIAGGRGGDQHESLAELVEEEGLAEHVHIVKNRSDVADLLAAADVFVMPSLWEGLPMALLEAMTAGKAIVASATFGIPEAITHDQEGLLVPPGDVAALAKTIGAVLGDQRRCSALGEAAKVRAHRDFTIGVMTDRYEKLYSEALLARQRRARSA